jgi:hypothetical protein
MIPSCKCGSNDIFSKARVSGYADCFYADIGQGVVEQNIDNLDWLHLKTVYCMRCRKGRRDLTIEHGILRKNKS